MMFREWIQKEKSNREESMQAVNVITHYILFYHLCWLERNSIRYGKTKSEQEKLKNQWLLDKTFHVYNMINKYMTSTNDTHFK